MSNHAGLLLARLRRKNNKTQRQLCSALGVSHLQSISNVECGYSRLPARWIPRLARLFGESEETFLKALRKDRSNETIARMYSDFPERYQAVRR